MKLSARTFTPAPEGVHDAICVDVFDLGEVDTQWGKKHKLRVTWEIDKKMDDGRPFIISKVYGASLSEKATLRKDLKTWRGRDFTQDELREFDLENIVNAPCQLVVVHNDSDGTVYSNISSVLKASANRLKASGKYIRAQDRAENKEDEGSQSDASDKSHEQPECPF